MTREGTTQVTEERDRRDWSDLGAIVLQAARRATAMHLVESAEAVALGADGELREAWEIDRQGTRRSARTKVRGSTVDVDRMRRDGWA